MLPDIVDATLTIVGTVAIVTLLVLMCIGYFSGGWGMVITSFLP